MNVVWGIRWDRDDDRRRLALLALVLLAVLTAVALVVLSRTAAPAATQAVIVRAEPGDLAAAQRAVEHAGGTVGQALPIVNGFVAHVPAGSQRDLGAAGAIAAVVDDGAV